MKYSQFVSQIKNIKPVYVFTGDVFLVENSIVLLKSELGIINDSTSLSVFDSENFSARGIINACEQMSFFDDKRMVVVKNLTNTISESDKSLFNKYVENPNPGCVLVFIENPEKSLFDFLKIEKVECSGLSDLELENMIKEFANSRNTKFEPDAIKLLIEYTQKKVQLIKNETTKLCDYKSQTKVINVSDVELMVAKQDEIIVFELTTALSQRQADKSITLLKKLMGTPDQNMKLFGLIMGNFRRMFLSVISKLPDAEIAKIFGVKEFAIKKAKQQAKNFSPKKLKNICELLSEVDYYSKSGIMSLENGLYYICFRILND